eukprot:TRINITY_DN5060_c0_g1_i4.p1 TRINITY_DN5060_c0_g1~~TRINITY_DN5060_c0_g1_i4.p1  ORF type:complete len:803 (+),score=135.04 TRINITY_DN5060_c0_g1_i4:69-2477(+)
MADALDLERKHWSTSKEEEQEEPLQCWHVLLITQAVAWPNIIVVLLLSDIGAGNVILGGVVYASTHSPIGSAVATLSLVTIVVLVLYIFDWATWPVLPKVLSGTVVLILVGVGLALGMSGASGSLLIMTLVLIPVFVFALRISICSLVDRHSFYRAVACTAAFSAILVLALWIVTEVVHSRNADGSGGWKHELLKRGGKIYSGMNRGMKARVDASKDYEHMCVNAVEETDADLESCRVARSVLFFLWAAPLIAAVTDILGCLFLLASRKHMRNVRDLVWNLSQAGAMCAAATMTFFLTAGASGISIKLGTTVLLCFMGIIFCVVTWIYVEMSHMLRRELGKQLENSSMHQEMRSVIHSEWTQAVFVGAFHIFIPIYFAVNRFRQLVRSVRGKTVGLTRFSAGTSLLFDAMSTWYWPGIFFKICFLGEVYFTLQVGVAKLVYVFLSWLNGQLASLPFLAVLALSYIIGVLLFVLLPPLPGVAVYLFCGILVQAQVNDMDGVPFFVGCLIGIVLALCCKVSGSLGQYFIGYKAYNSVTVQQQVCVDKVFIRAIEDILRRPGWDLGKIAVLVGGPDWPCSALCGILRIGAWQVVLGTLPVVIVLAPTVVAGACMTKDTGHPSSWKTAANLLMALTMVVQPLSTFLAFQSAAQVVSAKGELLKQPRPEHAEVEKLSRDRDMYEKVYRNETAWDKLSCFVQCLYVFAAACVYLSCLIFLLFGSKFCFRPFTVSSRIEDSYADKGLEGNWLNIVRLPIGVVTLMVFALGVFLHYLIGFLMKRSVKASMEYSSSEDYDSELETDDSLGQ